MHRHLILSSIMNPTRCRGPFLITLPSDIIINILSRLPIRTIVSCKCVCKQLLILLSTPEFAASHLSLSTPGLVIRQLGSDDYDKCQIFEFQDEFDLEHHNLHDNTVMKFDPSVSFGFSDFKLWISGSVHGILFMAGIENKPYDALYLCNPITREYIALPRIEGNGEYPKISEYGFGVSRVSGQYKVVRIRDVHRHSRDHEAAPHSTSQCYECLVYTVGTRSWRKVQPGKPFGRSHTLFSLFLNGNLHGLQDCGNSNNILISCFDLESESFKPFPPLPPPLDLPAYGTLGTLDDCLCFLDNSSQDNSCVLWVMKEYEVKESWTKQFVTAGSQDIVGKLYDTLYPIKTFKDGDILLNYNNDTLFYFCNKTKTCIDLDFVIQDQFSLTEAIPHSSSFLSLKIFEGENVMLFQ